MSLIILFPALACWIALARGSTRRALLNVYLPVMLLLPEYYVIRLPHLPPITFSDAAIMPLGLAILLTEMKRWRFSWVDLWVLLMAVSMGLSEALSKQLANGEWTDLLSARAVTSPTLGTNIANGGLMFIAGLFSVVMPYMIGKTLIERGGEEGDQMRRKFVGRVTLLLAIVAAISVIDFLKGGNTWQTFFGRIFASQQANGWLSQMRWGFGRIAGPYSHAILAGMMFLAGVVYCLWLRHVDPDWAGRRLVAGVPLTLRGLLTTGVFAGLVMTQSRGPWLGMMLALVFALLTRKFSVGKAAVLFLVMLTAFSVIAYRVGNRYTDKEMSQASTEEQRNAIYRRELLDSYMPLVMQQKAFGWGITTYPDVNGQGSIDNEYLLLAVTQGLFGLSMFVAVAVGSITRLLRLIARPTEHEDRMLMFAHLSVLIGLLTTLATVYLGQQVVILFYLLAGWIQAMQPRPAVAEAAAAQTTAGFRHVLV